MWIWRQVKWRKVRVEQYIFFFLNLNLWKWKSFYNFDLHQNHKESILAVCKYSRRLLTRALSAKVLSNNLSLWLFNTGSVTYSEILIFLKLKLYNSTLVSKSGSSLFKVFLFHQTRCAKLKMRELIIQGCPYWGVWGESKICTHQPKICTCPPEFFRTEILKLIV